MFKLGHTGNIIFNASEATQNISNKEELLSALAASEFAKCCVDHEAIEQYFKETPLAPTTVVAKKVDSKLEVIFTDNNMTAIGHLTTAQGGKHLSLLEAKKIIVLGGVRRGYQQALLERLLEQQSKLPAGASVKGTIAKGRLAENGQPARFEKETLTLKDRINQPQQRDDGTVDMRDFGKLASVQPGTPLMTQIPATPGKEGYTVKGDVLEPKPGKQVALKAGDGTQISANDPHKLIASREGVPIEIDNGMRVDDVYTIKDVTVKTGHIDFDGTVIITNNVEPGMRVSAKGDISVLGTVDSAELNAIGDITVKKGAFGHNTQKREDKTLTCRLTSHGHVHLSHGQYCYIDAHNITVDKVASHCQLKAIDEIILGSKEKPNGKLIGGQVLDASVIEAGEIGSDSGAKMVIHLASRGKQWTEENDENFKQLSDTDAQLSALQATLEKAEGLQDPEKKKKLIEQIGASQLKLIEQADILEQKTSAFETSLNDLVKNAKLIVHAKAHSGVEVQIFNKTLKLTRTYPPSIFTYENSKIEVEFKVS